ncbi:hypothetical protein BAE44_0012937 [Dichanthelium oligosanthes]|uniref:Uncharacterized protein n=1 Tax=Dichanthelium oligosanthes TaxID=888268 RepID=A0A1E5VLW1_9POAL|nr:hypothetical protein BAE44_0012937 [Dichanthelium oligosanthes]
MGQHLVNASLDAGHPTAVLVRKATATDAGKGKILEYFKSPVYAIRICCDVELAGQMLEPARSILGAKLRFREDVRAAGIPHTIISSNWLQGFLLPRAGNPEANGPPGNSVTIFGDGKPQDEWETISLFISNVTSQA